MEKINFLRIGKEWLEMKRFSIKYSSFVKYKKILNTHIFPYFKNKKLEDIDEFMVADYLFTLMKKEKLSISLCRSIQFILKGIFVYAEQKYHIKHLDFSFVKIPSEKSDNNILSESEREKLSHYCINTMDSTTLAVLLGLYAGVRLGEVCGLKWTDIDLDHDLIHIVRTVQRLDSEDDQLSKTKIMIMEPKSISSKRYIAIPQFLTEYIKIYHSLLDVNENEYYLLSNDKKPLDPRTLQRRFFNICSKFHIKATFHTLRHTYATNCIELDMDVKSVSEMLGHSNVAITLNRYVHPSIEFKKQQINKFQKP